MKIEFSAPSKTFLVGEYAVLRGGGALVLNTAPRFGLTARRRPGVIAGIPAGSPAAKWIEQREPLLRDWDLEFRDPHGARGGFGASSAQFLFVHCLTTFLQSSVSRAVQGVDYAALLNDFRVLSGGLASGADLLAQAAGAVAFVQPEKCAAEGTEWPFPDLGFAILRTGQKVATHEHLRELDPGSLERLVKPSENTIVAAREKRRDDFIAHLNEFARGLRELGLQAPATLQLLDKFSGEDWCLCAKGCGALGADTMFVLFERGNSSVALSFFRAHEMELVGTDRHLSGGLDMKWTFSDEG